MTLAAHRRLLVALDTADEAEARRLARELSGRVGGFKVGLELFSSHGPALVRELVEAGDEVFLDLKLHDIPNTVAAAAAAVARLGVHLFTVHALGGAEMVRRAVAAASEAANAAGRRPPVALVVTGLTSHDDDDLARVGLAGPARAAVLRLAELGLAAGAGGVVCSPHEVAEVRRRFPAALRVVPGIRPTGGATVAADDQARTATPARAVASGADRLVIGRPITRADDPRRAAEQIAAEVAGAG